MDEGIEEGIGGEAQHRALTICGDNDRVAGSRIEQALGEVIQRHVWADFGAGIVEGVKLAEE
jgi:hypothetical protein